MNNNGKKRSASQCCTESGVDIANDPGGKIFQGLQLDAFMADGRMKIAMRSDGAISRLKTYYTEIGSIHRICTKSE